MTKAEGRESGSGIFEGDVGGAGLRSNLGGPAAGARKIFEAWQRFGVQRSAAGRAGILSKRA